MRRSPQLHAEGDRLPVGAKEAMAKFGPIRPRGWPRLVPLLLAIAATATPVTGASTLEGELARRDGRPLEAIAGVDSAYGVLRTSDGLALRTIVTRPSGATGRLPAILFVQWLSCDTVELPESARGGWASMLRRLASESGMVMWRTEKAGVGDSEGDCAALDYESEVSHHRQALAAFRRHPNVDPSRIVVFGGSMGANMAPLVARGEQVAGVMIWGGGARTWFERQLAFSRQAMELSGESLDATSARMRRHAAFYAQYLLAGKTPAQIRREDPELGKVWLDIVGTEGDLHYGRPVTFHQQAQRQDWSAAWAEVNAPVLVLYGEHDWYEDPAAARSVVRVVNSREPGRARLEILPELDHHFGRFETAEAAYREQGGTIDAAPAVEAMLRWLRGLRLAR
jgi:pimeloyl-ACP methyl ester carboxylesterase